MFTWGIRQLPKLLLSGALLAGACSRLHPDAPPAHPGPPAAPVPPANLPALLSLSIDDLRQRLPTAGVVPAAYRQLNTPTDARQVDSVAAFQLQGLLLLADYDARTRQVHDLVVVGPREEELMRRASLHASTRDYLLLPVFQPNQPSRLLGLRVVPTK